MYESVATRRKLYKFAFLMNTFIMSYRRVLFLSKYQDKLVELRNGVKDTILFVLTFVSQPNIKWDNIFVNKLECKNQARRTRNNCTIGGRQSVLSPQRIRRIIEYRKANAARVGVGCVISVTFIRLMNATKP